MGFFEVCIHNILLELHWKSECNLSASHIHTVYTRVCLRYVLQTVHSGHYDCALLRFELGNVNGICAFDALVLVDTFDRALYPVTACTQHPGKWSNAAASWLHLLRRARRGESSSTKLTPPAHTLLAPLCQGCLLRGVRGVNIRPLC